MRDVNTILIGQKLKDHRLANGLRLQDVEAESGVSIANISRYENGYGAPKISTLSRILKVYNITIQELFTLS